MQPMMVTSLLSRNRSDALQDGKMKIVCHQSDLIILSKGRKTENKAPTRKCVVGCFPYSAKTPHFPIRATCTHDFNSQSALTSLETQSKSPKFHDLTFLSYRSSIKPPLLPRPNQSLAPFHHAGTASPCMSSPHLFPQPPSISQTSS